MAICEQIGGDDPGFRSQTLHALSNVVQDQEEAESLARKSLDLRRAALGTVENQPDLAIMLHDLSVLLVTNGKDLNEAENLEREALAIRRAAFGDNHRETIASFKRLVGILKREGKSETLEALRRESPELSRTDRQAPQDENFRQVRDPSPREPAPNRDYCTRSTRQDRLDGLCKDNCLGSLPEERQPRW